MCVLARWVAEHRVSQPRERQLNTLYLQAQLSQREWAAVRACSVWLWTSGVRRTVPRTYRVGDMQCPSVWSTATTSTSLLLLLLVILTFIATSQQQTEVPSSSACSQNIQIGHTRSARDLVKRKIFRDKRDHLIRRRRYITYTGPVSVQYRYTPVQDCAGWTYYRPYPINCGSCQPVPVRPPLPPPHRPAYTGSAKNWHGPKHGESY